jgi:hypothetical protein
MKTFRIGLVAVGLGVVLAGGGPLTAGRAAPQAAPPSELDVEIAVDGTGSMASAIAQVKASGVGFTDGLVSLLPNTRFSVVVFRDHGNPAGEYEVLQPFTSDRDKVDAGLNKITAAFNRDPNNTDAESYNLAFRKSYSDPQLGWRPSARKIVLMLGDAEPNGAGTDGLPGCKDRTRDPENLSTARELASMRAAGRTLIMVRELSHELSVSLQCYQSLAARAYVGGVARDATGDNLVSTMVELVQGAFAPLTLKPDLMTALRANRSGYTLKVQNPNLLPLTVKSVRVVLPRGFRYLPKTTTGMTRREPTVSGRTLVWSLTKVVGARQQGRLHVRVRTPHRLGKYRSTATGFVQTAAGTQLAPRTPAVLLRVKKRISAIAFRVHAPAAGRSIVSGGASARFRAGAKASSVVAARGSLLLRRGHGKRLLLRTKKLRLQRLAGPTRARLTLRIASARGLRGCRVGSSATLLLVYAPDLRSDETGGSYLKLSLPRACGGTLRRPAEITASDS